MIKASLKPESELKREGVGGDTMLIKSAALVVPLRYQNKLVVRAALYL